MAAVPVTLSATYDDATNTITISAILPPPDPPAGFVENETFWTMGAPSVDVNVPVSKKTPLTGGFAFYLKEDAAGKTRKYRVDFTSKGWQMPGTEVSYP